MGTQYKVVGRSKLDVMLNHKGVNEIQELPLGLKRVSAIGDGNCLLHSFLYSTDPEYRTAAPKQRKTRASNFRSELSTRIDELRADADAFYAEAGGSVVVEESLADLPEDRQELGIEIAPLIGRLYGYNVLAVRLDGMGTLRPVRSTWGHFNEALPTVMIHYVGGGLDFAQDEFMTDGHYEPVIYSEVVARTSEKSSESQKRKTQKRKAKTVTLPAETMYIFPSGAPQLGPVLALFQTPSEGAKAYTVEAAAAEAVAVEAEKAKATKKSSSERRTVKSSSERRKTKKSQSK
jgi:hypothetical protein